MSSMRSWLCQSECSASPSDALNAVQSPRLRAPEVSTAVESRLSPNTRPVVLSHEDVLRPESFSDRVRGGGDAIPAVGGDFTLAEIEQEHTLRVLARAPTREEAARILGIDPSTLWRRLKRYEDGGNEPGAS